MKGLKKQDDDATADVWNAKATFKDITYWRHDDNPHSIDSGHKFFDWLHVASMEFDLTCIWIYICVRGANAVEF